jgi:primosomal protein N' (replication factor Y)
MSELRCHYCDHRQPPPTACPACSGQTLHFAGAGTERIEDVLGQVLPEARVVRMDSDTMSGRDAHGQALAAFARGEYDVLLGTQMVAKGVDFPNVTLVGVLMADESLRLPDFRAAERCFQLVAQVIGRAGRAGKPGRAVVQAFQPGHSAVAQALRQDYPAFARRECEDRDGLGYPPFGRLVRVLVRGPQERAVAAAATRVAEGLAPALGRDVTLLGPAPCPLGRLQGQVRYHLLLKARSQQAINRVLDAHAEALDARGRVHVAVDVDPVSML